MVEKPGGCSPDSPRQARHRPFCAFPAGSMPSSEPRLQSRAARRRRAALRCTARLPRLRGRRLARRGGSLGTAAACHRPRECPISCMRREVSRMYGEKNMERMPPTYAYPAAAAQARWCRCASRALRRSRGARSGHPAPAGHAQPAPLARTRPGAAPLREGAGHKAKVAGEEAAGLHQAEAQAEVRRDLLVVGGAAVRGVVPLRNASVRATHVHCSTQAGAGRRGAAA